jgi:hypothetical protein
MNFLDARLTGGDGDVTLLAGGLEFRMPPEIAGSWRPYCGHNITIGIGPEDLGISDINGGAGVIPATVILIESNGNTLMGTCAALGRELSGVAAKRTIKPRQEVFLRVNWAKAMLFERQSGRTLRVPAG